MVPIHLVLAICIGVWYLVKQTAITFQVPWMWDYAEIVAAVVGALGFSYIQQPYLAYHPDPLSVLVFRSLQFGVGVLMTLLMAGIVMEEEGLLRTPDKLAPPKARILEKVSSVDELDDETMAKYTEGAQ